jgi:murein L,D-transpeptidase YafK
MAGLGRWIRRSATDWLWIGGVFATVSAVVLLVIELGLITTIEHEFKEPVTERLINKNVQWGAPVYIRIFKETSELELWAEQNGQYILFETYPICRWSGSLGPKVNEGDMQSPEGFYQVGLRQLNPNSQYHLAFNLGFPNAFDRANGRTGSFLMVHGGCTSAGCYAMTNTVIEEIYGLMETALYAGQRNVPVHIFPFPLTEDNLARHEKSEWIGFWRDLKPAYDFFEANQSPPSVDVAEKTYVLRASKARPPAVQAKPQATF